MRNISRETRHTQIELALLAELASLIVSELGERFPLISITRIELTRDRKDGIVWVVASQEVEPDKLIKECNYYLPRWRREIRARMDIRYFPNLVFKYDEGQEDLLKIDKLLGSENGN